MYRFDIISFNGSDQRIQHASYGLSVRINPVVKGQAKGKRKDRYKHRDNKVPSFLVIEIPRTAANADDERQHDPNPEVIEE